MKTWLQAIGLAGAVASSAACAAGLREKVLLNQGWNLAVVESLDPAATAPPSLEGLRWQTVDVPYCGTWPCSWWRKEFEVPDSMRDKRIRLRFEAVSFQAIVWVNGKKVGEHFGARMPFEVDLTEVVQFQAANQVLVGMIDQSNAAKGRWHPTDNIGNASGIWQDVSLVAYPRVYMEDVWVIPSYRQKSLRLEIALRNESDEDFTGEILNQVLDQGKPIKTFPRERFRVGAHDQTVLKRSYAWRAPRLWTPEAPNLYGLQCQVFNKGQVQDETQVRFGFREVWVEGDHLMLNGRRLHLRGDAAYPAATFPHPEILNLILNGGWDGRPSIRDKQGTREWYKERFLLRKSWGLNYSRNHINPPHSDYLEVADEVGYFIQPEFYWAWGHACQDPDPPLGNLEVIAFPQYREWVNRDRNHPSVLVWGAENEYLLHYLYHHPAYADQARELLLQVHEFLQSLDPTRAATFEGDGCLGGSLTDDGATGPAETIGWHYHREVSQGYTWVPNTYYWLLDPQETPGWSRKKPLWVGEALSADMLDKWDTLTIFQGEKVYEDPSPTSQPWWPGDDKGAYVAQAFSDSVRMQMEAWRYVGVNWGNWTYWNRADPTYTASEVIRRITQESARACAQLAVLVREYDHNFYSEETIARELSVYNDLFHDAQLLLTWATMLDGQVLESARTPFSLRAGESQRLHVTLHLPRVETRRELKFRLNLEEPGTQNQFEDEKIYTVFPARRSPLQTSARIAVFDPRGNNTRLLRAFGLKPARVSDLREISRDPFDVLILGQGSLPPVVEIPGLAPKETDQPILEGFRKVEEFVAEGGRVLVFEQEHLSPSFLSMGLKLKDSVSATMTFNLAPHHPVMQGLEADDLKFWRGDHVVSQKPLVKPDSGNLTTLMESGTGQGLIVTPLLEVQIGQGTVLFSQLDLTEKFGKEPAADLLARNLLAYVTRYAEKSLSKAALVAEPSSAVASFLRNVGADLENLRGRLSRADLSAYPSLLVDATENGNTAEIKDHLDAVKRYLAGGGKLLLHGLKPGDEGIVPSLTGANLVARPIQQNDCAWKVVSHPLLDGLSNFELWYGLHRNYVRAQGRKTIETGWSVQSGEGLVLVEPGALVVLKSGQGLVVVDQVLWEGSDEDSLSKRRRYVSTLLTHLGVSLALARPGSERLLHPLDRLVCVDLRPYANMGFRDETAGDGQGGWSDEGANDLKYFPVGRQVFRGLLFEVIDPGTNNGKSCLQPFFTQERAIKGIQVNRRLQSLYFLYGGAFTYGDHGAEMAYYEVHYEDGQTVRGPLRFGLEIADWYNPVPESETVKKAWEGDNGFHSPIFITLYEWRNPRPEKEITSVDLILPPTSPSRYGLIAITGLLPGEGSKAQEEVCAENLRRLGKAFLETERLTSCSLTDTWNSWGRTRSAGRTRSEKKR